MIMGSGAVGGYYGAHLASTEGVDVSFVARGRHLEAIRKNGLKITGNKELHVKSVRTLEHPEELGHPPDLIIVAVKSFDTPDAINMIRPVVRSGTMILTLQNGLENYDLLAAEFGKERVIRGFCQIGVEVTEPGVIDYRGMSRVVFGEESGASSNRVMQLQKMFELAGVPARVSDNIRKDSWLKFIWNGIFNMITGISGVTTDRIFEDDDTLATARELFFEMKALAGASGVSITDEDVSKIIDDTRKLGAFRTSTYQDRLKGKPLEYDTFCGYVVRKADEYELEVPVNRTLYSLYKLRER